MSEYYNNCAERSYKANSSKHLLAAIPLDGILLTLLLLLITFGLFILYSASCQSLAMVTKQASRAFLGLVLMFGIACLPTQPIRRASPYLYIISLILLIAVLVVGKMGQGAQRWLSLGFMRFQPSELIKLAMPMMLAWYLQHQTLPLKGRSLAVSLVIILFPALLTIKQPDLGTAIVIMLSGVCVLLLAGTPKRVIFMGVILLLCSCPVIWHGLHGYQKQRILTFLHPESDPLGAGYHILQSKIALGSGGFWGKGYLMGTQSHLLFLPEHTTDFIFAVAGEELGWLGCLLILMLYAAIGLRCLFISMTAQHTYDRLISATLGILFFLSALINTGMVMGLLPVVGVPLTFISYGGSSMLTALVGFGIIMSVHSHKKLLSS